MAVYERPRSRKFRYWKLALALTCVFVLVFSLQVIAMTVNEGADTLEKVSGRLQYPIDDTMRIISYRTGSSATMIRWCVGLDAWVRMPGLAALRPAAQWPCPYDLWRD